MMQTENANQATIKTGPCAATELSPASGYAYAVVRLTDLRITRCADKDELYDAISAYKKRQIGYIPLRYHGGAQTWVALGVRE